MSSLNDIPESGAEDKSMQQSNQDRIYDVIVVGGGPAGATAANDLASKGLEVMLLDRAGRIKPCGGAVPPQLLIDFEVPRNVLEAEVDSARMISPSNKASDMPIESGFVGMVDRGYFDEWLRKRAADSGAVRQLGTFKEVGASDGTSVPLTFVEGRKGKGGDDVTVRARYVIGADGAHSKVGRKRIPIAGYFRMEKPSALEPVPQFKVSASGKR